MFRIRRIYDDTLPLDREAIVQVQGILRSQFGALSEADVNKLPGQLRNPLKYRFRCILFVADNVRGKVRGFALLQHAPDVDFCCLDFISVEPKGSGGGVGGALYERVREEARLLDGIGLFFECLPDEPSLCGDRQLLRQNRARLRFYERFGARPIINTAYETPLKPGDRCAPYLVFDPLGRDGRLSREKARSVVRAILERKYGKSSPPGYIDMVVESFQDDPVRLREPRYGKSETPSRVRFPSSIDMKIALVVNDKHTIHHVHERGYVESPVRVGSILRGILDTHLFTRIPPRHFPERIVKEVHDLHYVEYLKRMCTKVEEGRSVYPYVFPIRNATKPPRELPLRAGYYCIDTFTPLNRSAYVAAKGAVDCALTAARAILQGYRLAYALVRPPGHHAERRAFGGFCYFNSSAIAAHYLSAHGKVAVLDVDYHHGNGTQDIFYERADVFTASIHGHPHFAYPYFTGFQDERGRGAGVGYNLNLPLPETVGGAEYRQALARALRRLRRFHPKFLVVAFGLDLAKDDPTGSWSLQAADFEANARMIGSLRIPTVVVQEGGYRVRSLGTNARHFFLGLWEGFHGRPPEDEGARPL
jgi:acetoin utilization deacetylase AcuC-like enzyme/GNAT superfamily N-acetyltransferase